MAVARTYHPRLIDDGKGGFRAETVEEREERRKKEYEEAERKEVQRIFAFGFTKQQAEYLRELELKIERAAHTYVPPPVY